MNYLSKRNASAVLLLLISGFFQLAYGQPLTGTKTVCSSGCDYPTLTAAVTALNGNGVGSGGVVFNVSANYVERLTASLVITASGTAADPIVFQRSGVGANPILTAYVGTTTTSDAPVKIRGGDYITIDGIDLKDTSFNTTTTTQMEWGYALVKFQNSAPFNGCQNVTIKNCTVNLNRTYTTTKGIYIGNNIATSTTALTITATTDAHNNIKIYSNKVTNCFSGIYANGYNQATGPYTLYDQNIDVGGNSPATGNTVTNFGGTTTAYGIYLSSQNNATIGYNTINNIADGGVIVTSTTHGIYALNGITSNITYRQNFIFLTGSNALYSIRSDVGGNVLIDGNTLKDSVTSGTSTVYMVFSNTDVPASMTLTGNTVSNCTFSGTGTTYGYYVDNIDGNVTVTGNTITDITRNSASGVFTGFSIGSGSYLNGTANITNNTFTNFSYTGSGSVNVFLIKGYNTHNISGNVVSNSSTGTGLFYAIYAAQDGTVSNVYNNQVSNITTSGTIYGIYYYAYNFRSGEIYNNAISGLTTSAPLIKGMYIHFGDATSTGFFKVYNNRIANLTTNSITVSSTCEGININGVALSKDTVQLYNNIIANIKAPASTNPTAVAGLNIASASTQGLVSAWYNSIYLSGTSSGVGFGSSGIMASTASLFAAANNIVMNSTVPTGTSKAVAYRRSSAATGTYDAQSDNNIFYAGAIPSASNAIFYDGASVDSLLSDYQARMAPREISSVRENVTFISTTAGSVNLLQPDSTIGTFIESAGKNIAGITTDINGRKRAGNPGYTGTGTNPDIGAYEGNLTPKQMVYDSSMADQVTELAARKPLQAVLRIRVYTENPFNPLNATSFRLNTAGTTSAANLDSAKMYFTGPNNFFYPGTSFGSTILSPSGTMQFSGNVPLASGVNYFWLVYDVKATATPGSVIDARLDSMLIGGVYRIPTEGNPAGSRMISTPIAAGTYAVGTGLDYTTLADAVTAVNERGIAGAVVMNLGPGFTERAPVGGYRLGSATLNGSLSVTNTLTFQKNGAGVNPLIFANIGSSLSADGIFIIQGTDYVTMDQIDLVDTNTTGNKMEWGYALLKRQTVAPFDGCQFVTIKNCTVTLLRTNTASKGIYVSNHTANAVGFKPDLVNTADAHNNNKIYGNTITNCFIAVHIEGANAATPFTLYDQNNDIGGNTASTGNTFSNFGGAASTAYGVYAIYQNNLRIAHNIIDNTANGGVGHLSVLYGIFHGTGESSNLLIDSNQITLTMDASGSAAVYSIATSVTGNLTIRKNTLRDSTLVAITGAINFIYNLTNGVSETITGNTIYNSTLITTGAIYLGNLSNLTPSVVISDNIISNIKRTAASGTHFGFYSFIGDTSPGTASIYNNTFSDLQNAGSGTWYAINWGACAVHNIYGNTINNITSGTGTLHAIADLEYGRVANIYNNTLSNINTGGAFNGIYFNGTNYTSGIFYDNTFRDINSTGTPLRGIYMQFPTSGLLGTFEVYRNKIKGLSTTSATGIADGFYLNAASGSTLTFNVYNNIIGNVGAVNSSNAAAVSGINVSSTGMNVNLYYNTIYITGAGTNAAFGTSGIYAHTGSVLTANNNIVINNTVPGSSGKAVAFRRSSATLTSYLPSSNNNIWFAGATPSASNAIFYDGTSTDITLALFKTRVTPADSLSGTENAQFISTSNVSGNFLQLDSTLLTYAESGGKQIAGITTDINGRIRYGNAGYTGTGVGTDIGAFEGELTGTTMLLDSAVITQITGPVAKDSLNQLVLKIALYTKNPLHPFVLERFKLSTNGSSNPADIARARVFSTGNSPVFSTASQYGTTVVSPSGSFFVTGTKLLGVGVNYFWLTYDIAPAAGTGNLIDAVVDSIKLTGANYTPLDGNPVGSREVKAVMSGLYPIGSSHPYTTLTAAINDLTSIGVNGPVILELQDSYNPAAETFPVTIPVIAGTSSTNTMTIRPSSTTTVTLSASVPTSLFILNGADYVTFNGMQGGISAPKSMILYNTHTDGNDVVFMNDATHNRLKHLECKGVNTSATGGLIRFSTGITTGNDDNLVDSCDLHDGATKPAAIIYALGSTTTTAAYNSNNTISNCNIYNFWSPLGESDGISVANGNTDWTISGNHFYQAATLTATGIATQYVLNLNNGGNAAALNNMQISGNYIGGGAPMAGGAAWTLTGTAAVKFTGCLLNLGSTVASGFTNNTISNFSWTTADATTAYPGAWSAAYCSAGVMNVSNNVIGSINSTNNIVVTSAASSSTIMGISASNLAAGNMSFSGNTFGGIKTAGTTATVSASLTLMGFSGSTGTTRLRVDSNSFGNDMADNIVAFNPTSTGAQSIIGLQHSGTSHLNVRNNVLRNFRNYFQGTGAGVLDGMAIASSGTDTITGNLLVGFTSNAANTNPAASASMIGIHLIPSSSGNVVSKNVLKNFTNTHPTAANVMHGINTNNTTGLIISSNTISGFNSFSNSSAAKITGINFQGGVARTINNMICMGSDSLGASINNTINFVGLNKSAVGNLSLYFNAVLINGTTTVTGTASTYACNRTATGTDTIMNNMFINLRTNNTTGGSHFAIGIVGTLTLKQDYNLLYTPVIAGDSVAQLGTIGYYALTDWNTASGLDLNSRSKNVSFVSATNLHLASPSIGDTALACLPVAAIENDFDGDSRNASKPYKGADENTAVPVPVKLISFEGSNDKGDVKLAWITASESHNTGFMIQRLTAEKEFKDLDFVKTQGNATVMHAYNYTDADAFSVAGTGVLYYRLKQTDDDGTVSYSEIISVSNDENNGDEKIRVFPNPFSEHLVIAYYGSGDEIPQVTVTDLQGRVVQQGKASVLNGGRTFTIKINEEIESGIYFVKVEANGISEVYKRIKE